MTTVDAEIWVWSVNGMVRSKDTADGLIRARDVERLLEEAHRRGYERGYEARIEDEKVLDRVFLR